MGRTRSNLWYRRLNVSLHPRRGPSKDRDTDLVIVQAKCNHEGQLCVPLPSRQINAARAVWLERVRVLPNGVIAESALGLALVAGVRVEFKPVLDLFPGVGRTLISVRCRKGGRPSVLERSYVSAKENAHPKKVYLFVTIPDDPTRVTILCPRSSCRVISNLPFRRLAVKTRGCSVHDNGQSSGWRPESNEPERTHTEGILTSKDSAPPRAAALGIVDVVLTVVVLVDPERMRRLEHFPFQPTPPRQLSALFRCTVDGGMTTSDSRE